MLSFSRLSLSFCMLLILTTADVLPFSNSKEYQNGDLGYYPNQTFRSDPHVLAPVANVLVQANEGLSPNQYITWAPTGPRIPAQGPQLLDADTLSLVYQAPNLNSDNFGISVQSCNNTDYLIYWSGDRMQNRAAGTHHVLNSSYHSVWNISAVGFPYADAHDIFLTPECTVILIVTEPREYNLSDYGIEKGGWIMETYIQEVDPVTKSLLFQWRASDHVNLNDTFWYPNIRGGTNASHWQGASREHSWDFFHLNSVQKDEHGNYLISARHMNSLYYVEGKTGNILWTLGGRKNHFTDLSEGRATDFSWQHHARWVSPDLTKISLFDDRNCRNIKSLDTVSRGVVLQLDYMTKTVRVDKEYRATSDIDSFRKGGMHYLENGNALLGYGNEPGFTEYAPNGTVLWDVRFGPLGLDRASADNYRSLKVNWTGNPTWNPKIAAGASVDSDGNGSTTLLPTANDTAYFSWNGATRLVSWAVLASNDSFELGNMTMLWRRVPRSGFETSIHVGTAARFIRAIAMSAAGDVLAASPILDMLDGKTSDAGWNSVGFGRTEANKLEEAEKEEKINDGKTTMEEEASHNDDVHLAGDETDEDGENGEMGAQYSDLRDDWFIMSTSTWHILSLVLFGCLFAIFVTVVILSWQYRDAYMGWINSGGKRGYRSPGHLYCEEDGGDEDEMSDIQRQDIMSADDSKAEKETFVKAFRDSTSSDEASLK